MDADSVWRASWASQIGGGFRRTERPPSQPCGAPQGHGKGKEERQSALCMARLVGESSKPKMTIIFRRPVMLNPARRIYPRRVLALVLALIFVMWAGAGAALADNFAGLTVTAGQPQPTIIGPGDSYSVPFQSALQPNEPGVENLFATGQAWTITSVA